MCIFIQFFFSIFLLRIKKIDKIIFFFSFGKDSFFSKVLKKLHCTRTEKIHISDQGASFSELNDMHRQYFPFTENFWLNLVFRPGKEGHFNRRSRNLDTDSYSPQMNVVLNVRQIKTEPWFLSI